MTDGVERTRTDLLPCPFCGGEAQMLIHTFNGVPNCYGVRCLRCLAATVQFFDTEEEAAEQAALRHEYLAEFRENMKAMLDNTVIQEPDGTRHALKQKDNPPVQ